MEGVVEMVNPVVAMARRPVQRRRNAERLRQGSPAAIRQEGFRNVNGVEQWVTVRGEDRANPLLLFVHGGPGSSYTPFNAWLTDWERHFTLVQWDQPGAGRTFQRAGRTGPADLTLDALAGHGIELVRQLCADLGHRRVILLGSSVGSVIGLLMARRRGRARPPGRGTRLLCARRGRHHHPAGTRPAPGRRDARPARGPGRR
jgi:pimeloyl-ACP methyl ester carboxylesterase